MNDIPWIPATELAALYRSRELSPVEVVDAVLDRLDQVNPRINAFVTVTAEQARREAQEAERKFARGEDSPILLGIPVTVKDLTDTAGVRTTYGVRAHADHVPDQDAISWERMKAAGAILIGKTTTPEYGALGITDSHLTGSTSTPWDLTRVSGGSSGGAAAAVACGIAPLALGSDGGGSIRVPASCCGVVGVKPSVGRVPVRENFETDSTEGPLTRTVADAALLLQVISGPHPEDRLSMPDTKEDFVGALAGASMEGLRIAYSPRLGAGPVDPDTKWGIEQTLDAAEKAGATVTLVEVTLPDVEEFFIAYWGPDYLRIVDELGPLGQSWDLIDEIADKAKRLTPLQVSHAFREGRSEMYREFATALAGHDILVAPTTPMPAYSHLANEAEGDGGDRTHLLHKHLHAYTEPPSHAGLPALSIPAGFSDTGLPVGMQIIGKLHEDVTILRAAAAFEVVAPWADRRPLAEE